MKYGDVLPPSHLAGSPLPRPRGPQTEWLFDALRRAPGHLGLGPCPTDDPLDGEDRTLALYCLYELHYRGFCGVDDGWEWEPSLLAVRARLEADFERRVREEAGPGTGAAVPEALYELLRPTPDAPPSLSSYLAEDGTFEQLREYCVHRSAYQLKEADPHTWALPRLTGAAKAAMVEIQADEYGAGAERDMHQTLFAVTMDELGLDTKYHAYLDLLPAETLATVNLVSLFGLHRRLRGALVGHLAMFEMTSVEPMGRYSAALRRHGASAAARHFYDAHVVADAHHQHVAAEQLAAGLVAAEPALAADVVLGAQAVSVLEARFAARLMSSWTAGRTSLRRPLAATHHLAS